MPEISLTDFVDFAITSPPSQLTKVRQLHKRGDYDPRFDFWKALRELIQDHHNGTAKLLLPITGLADPKKMTRYPVALAAYKKFLQKQGPVATFKAPSAKWIYQGLTVRVNPELGLIIDGRRYATKLYFKDEKPTKHRLNVVFELMRLALKLDVTTTAAVIDVSAGRLITPKPLDQDLTPLLEAQALAFMHLWKAVSGMGKAAGAP